MTITRRELMKDGVVAMVSVLPLVNLITANRKDELQPSESPERGRIWLNDHTHNFEIADELARLELVQWARTNPETGAHIHIGHRYLFTAVCRRGEVGEGQHYRFDLDSSQKWQSQRTEAVEVLRALPGIVRPKHPQGFQYDHQKALHEQISVVLLARTITFICTCERFARIIERMTPPDQIVVETYPELSPNQAGHGSH